MAAPIAEKYLILTTTSPTTVYPVDNITLRENVYTTTEIDMMLQKFSEDLKKMIDDTIVMSEYTAAPDPEATQLWLEIKDTDTTGNFTDWYNHNSTLDD